MSRPALKIEPGGRNAPDLGPLLDVDGVRGFLPEGARARVSDDWLREHVRPRVKVGRMVFWYEADVRRFFEAQREDA